MHSRDLDTANKQILGTPSASDAHAKKIDDQIRQQIQRARKAPTAKKRKTTQ